MLTDGVEWHDTVAKHVILKIVSRMSSRIFVGKRLGRNEKWLSTIVGYVELSVHAMQNLRFWPKFLRGIVVYFLPGPTKLRAYIRDAETQVFAEIKHRQQEGDSVGEYNDAIEWFKEMAKGQKFNPAVAQLILAGVAIHTTADLVTQTLYDILQHPELIQPLREEAIQVIGEGGWKKTSLYNMKLMDSVLKESQRLKPNQIGKFFQYHLHELQTKGNFAHRHRKSEWPVAPQQTSSYPMERSSAAAARLSSQPSACGMTKFTRTRTSSMAIDSTASAAAPTTQLASLLAPA